MPWVGPQCVIVVFSDHTHFSVLRRGQYIDLQLYSQIKNVIKRRSCKNLHKPSRVRSPLRSVCNEVDSVPLKAQCEDDLLFWTITTPIRTFNERLQIEADCFWCLENRLTKCCCLQTQFHKKGTYLPLIK